MLNHLVARLTMESGHQFALDISSPQFGWQECLTPWAEYEKHRIHNPSKMETSTYPAGFFMTAKPEHLQPEDYCMEKMRWILYDQMKAATKNAALWHGFIDLQDVLRLKSGEFAKLKTDLMAQAKSALDRTVETVTKTNLLRRHYNGKAKNCAHDRCSAQRTCRP
jgi:hypothetical protein